jgi:hypothetical protein
VAGGAGTATVGRLAIRSARLAASAAPCLASRDARVSASLAAACSASPALTSPAGLPSRSIRRLWPSDT